MDKIVITERNRDGAKLWLEPVEDMPDLYTIHTDDKHGYVLQYSSVNYDRLDDNAQDYDAEFINPDGTIKKAMIHSFDPSGGPYMTKGYEIGDLKIERILMKKDEPTCFKMIKRDNN